MKRTESLHELLNEKGNIFETAERACAQARQKAVSESKTPEEDVAGETEREHRRLLTGRTAKGKRRLKLQEISQHGRPQQQA